MAWLERCVRAGRGWKAVGLAAAALFVSSLLLPASGCTTTETIDGDLCVGGFVDEEGNCHAKCDPALCLPGNVCVNNQCRLECTSHDDCYLGFQACTAATTDPNPQVQEPVYVCLENGHAPVLTNGYPAGWYGLNCINGDIDCAAQLGCPNGLECNPQSCADCTLDEVACAGKEELCNIGTCASTGERCTLNTCPLDQCTPFQCVNYIGQGDTEAYCTNTDCTEDSHCPAGFHCGDVKDPRPYCPTGTGGDAELCGPNPNNDPCVDPAAIPGSSYFEGPSCLMQRACVLRDECSPCTSNVDCSLGRGDVCANHAGVNSCQRFCADDTNCLADEACVPYVAASGKGAQTCSQSPNVDCLEPAADYCPVPGDVCVPRSVCAPRSGACDASNLTDKFCGHCTSDSQCGPAGSGWACVAINGDERACLNTCTSNTQCTAPPSGLPTVCVGNTDHPLFGFCVAIKNDVPACW